ncbi:hypothetical protein F0562_033980 [Nyssa sinensis]|uniref:SLH domain-containing protein n=1 Tax=Nyssa sinensis TaxID=561372 RepID=A0A5J5AJ91_9ASTE|nr:hypothetical protein F0562_033980 [Nyssa sinensis]
MKTPGICSLPSPSSLFLPTNTRFPFHRCNASVLNSSHSILISHRSRNPRSSFSVSVAERDLEASWFAPERNATDDYGGWAIVETPRPKKKKGLPPFLLVGIGTSIAALLASIAHFSLSRRGFQFRLSSPLHALHGMLMPSGPNKAIDSKTVDADASSWNDVAPVGSLESVSDVVVESVAAETNIIKRQEGKLGRIIIPVAVDSTQQEALLMLKKLKIIEDDVKADELCTRREYARWLVQTYLLLERSPKHRIVPYIALSGSIIAAFDDVSIEDPDFWPIQSLAEAGIILSNLSGKNSSPDLDDSEGHKGVNFFPERFISRQDLISWKAQIDNEAEPGINEKISRINMGFMDVKEISADAPPELFMDMLAGDKSILRNVFGHVKRFQPNKPSTTAQAAVALTSGRMTEVIHTELSRLEAEKSLRQNAMEEIRSELLDRGDIQRYWDEKLEEEKTRGCEVERAYLAAVHDLEQEKIVQENTLAEYLKEKAAMDCQKQLLFNLKEEVNEMSERLQLERAKHMDEKRNLQDMLSNLQGKQEGLLVARSILEAEIEALRILRSWIEDEARKNKARAKVLEEVGRRWKWDDQA